jgi:hypothetical protein
MQAPAPLANSRSDSRASLYVATAAVLAVIGLNWPSTEANQGQDTTCADFVRMAPDQQRAVMDRAGIRTALTEARIVYFVTQCRADPGNSAKAIGSLW